MWKIPLSDIDFDGREVEAVTAVLNSKWLTMGEVTLKFERAFAELVGVPHAFAVTNCTAALQLAYRAVGVGPGDEVIMPSLTFVATANAAVVEGGVPVFADVIGENDLTLLPEDVLRKITPRTKAITVVHYAGYPCAIGAIMRIAEEHGLAVVEDCAHSPGASSEGRQTGAIGDVGCFSFFSNKNMTTGEGGMLTTRRDDLAERIRLLRSHGMTTLTLDRHKGHSFTYDVVDAGYNFRIDEVRSALGLVQLSKLEAANRRRAEIVRLYRSLLAESSDDAGGGLRLPFAGREEGAAFHIMPALLDAGVNREAFMAEMRRAGVQTSIHYPPVHGFSYYRERSGDYLPDLPVTESVGRRLVTLPLYPGMSDEQVQEVADAVRQSLRAATETGAALNAHTG